MQQNAIPKYGFWSKRHSPRSVIYKSHFEIAITAVDATCTIHKTETSLVSPELPKKPGPEPESEHDSISNSGELEATSHEHNVTVRDHASKTPEPEPELSQAASDKLTVGSENPEVESDHQTSTSEATDSTPSENNIIVRDYGSKGSKPLVEHFNPYSALADYEYCMRRGSHQHTINLSSWDPLLDPSSTIEQNLATLPDQAQNDWGMSPLSSAQFPLMYLTPAGLRDLVNIRWLLDAFPYESAPVPTQVGYPRDLPSRYSPIPGKILHRLVEIGWVSDKEALERWTDNDWFSLRDYRRHLEEHGGGAFKVMVRPYDKERYGTGVPDKETRERVRRDAALFVDRERRRLEMRSLMLVLETDDEEVVREWYRKNGYGYLASKEEQQQLAKDDTGGDGACKQLQPEHEAAEVVASVSPEPNEHSPSSSSSSSPARRASPSCIPDSPSSPNPHTCAPPTEALTSAPSTPALSTSFVSRDSTFTPPPRTPRTDATDLALVHDDDNTSLVDVDAEPVKQKKRARNEDIEESPKKREQGTSRAALSRVAKPSDPAVSDRRTSARLSTGSSKKRAREEEEEDDDDDDGDDDSNQPAKKRKVVTETSTVSVSDSSFTGRRRSRRIADLRDGGSGQGSGR